MSEPEEPKAAQWPDSAWVAKALWRRVTVRSVAGEAGPTGGPGFRDVVGVLESVESIGAPEWQIRNRFGELVLVDPARVVAAKIVPDTPARLRSAPEIDIASLEAIAAQAWQPLESEELGDWVLRAAVGFTGRANSVLPLGDPGKPLDDALTDVAHWYAARSLPPLIQVPLPLRVDLDDELAERGWERDNAVCVMVCDLDPLLMATQGASARAALRPATVDIARTPDAAWLASFRYGTDPVPAEAVPMMTNAEHPVFVSARGHSGELLAIARGAVCQQWLGITAVEVAPPYRRQGLGRAVIGALADYATGLGCRHVFLQVAHDNGGARTLYETLGFVAHHDYVYRCLAAGRR